MLKRFCTECGQALLAGECLTAREFSIVKLIATGMSSKLIAHELYITEGTFKIYIRRMYAKLGLVGHNRVVLTLMFKDGAFNRHVCQTKEN